MPHIIFEHSLKIEKENKAKLVEQLRLPFISMKDAGSFDVSQCKFRLIKFDDFYLDSFCSNSPNFAHLTIKILEGRSVEVKCALTKLFFDILQKFIQSQLLISGVDISVDLVEMNKLTYQKARI